MLSRSVNFRRYWKLGYGPEIDVLHPHHGLDRQQNPAHLTGSHRGQWAGLVIGIPTADSTLSFWLVVR
jgi:hypothetical protein